MRDIRVIIAQIVDIISKNNFTINNKFVILNNKLKKMLQSMCYSPPEKIFSPHYWHIISAELNNYISIDDYNNIDWVKELIDIFQDKSNDIGVRSKIEK